MGKLERVTICIANQKPKRLTVEEVSKWEPKNISRMGGDVYFKVDNDYVSMKVNDYNKIFE